MDDQSVLIGWRQPFPIDLDSDGLRLGSSGDARSTPLSQGIAMGLHQPCHFGQLFGDSRVPFQIRRQLAEAFGLDKDRYVPVMILSVGKAAEEGYQSVRLDAEKITSFK